MHILVLNYNSLINKLIIILRHNYNNIDTMWKLIKLNKNKITNAIT